MGLHNADDLDIFNHARAAGAAIMTKDRDFLDLLDRFGPPPQIIWITCGNTSNAHLRRLLSVAMSKAIDRPDQGERLIEISDASP